MGILGDVLGGAASVVGGLIGSGSRSNKGAEMSAEAINQWLQLNVPDPSQQKLALKEFVQQGLLDPAQEQQILQGQSKMAGISLDPVTRQAQLSALNELQGISSSGGMRLNDQAMLDQAMGQVATDAAGRNQAVQQGMARRGMGGSGMELAAKLMNQQNASQLNSQAGLASAGMAQQRALEAIMQGGQLGGQMRGQDWQQASEAARAQDAINQFNTQNSIGAQQRNIAGQNQAQATNLGATQKIADQNTNLSNQEQMHNTGLIQQDYENKMARAAGASGQYNTGAKRSDAADNASAKGGADAGAGAGDIIAGAFGDDEKKKKKIIEDDQTRLYNTTNINA